MTLEQFLQYIMTPAGLGAAAVVVMYVIQKIKPVIQDDLAYILSVVISALLGIGAYFVLPFVDKLPPEVGTVIWPILVWCWNYLWFRFGPKRAAARAK